MEWDNDITITYFIKKAIATKKSLREVVDTIAAGISIGTLQVAYDAHTTKWHADKAANPNAYKAEVEDYNVLPMDENSAVVKIKVCSDLMDLKHCSFATLLSFIAGDVFGTSYDAEEIRVLDIDFSEKALAQFKGPKFGSEGIRKILGLESSDRPLQALILKPNTGQPSSHYADIAYKAALGGMDFIKDDELNINPTSCPFEERVKLICDALKEAEKETGKKTIYAPNISFRPEYMKEYARKAIAAGASALMMNIVYVGMTAVQMIAEDPEFDVPIYVHRAGHDFFTRNEVGIAMPVMTKFFRLSGADIMSVGPVFGGLETKETVKKTYDSVNADMYGINKSLAVVSRSSKDIVQGTVDWLQTKNVMFLADGGIYNGPEGITATTKEMKETIEKVQIQSA